MRDYRDVVVFDPATVQDHASYETPQRFATGIRHVLVNGRFALRDGEPTGAATGRFVKGRAVQGGCRAASAGWSRSK